MNAGGQPSVGQLLRETRAARGITVDEAAVRLRLMHRQIEAMEADDFESLGRPVFARGFVRNYARLLGLAAEPLLARMEGAPAEPAVAVAEAPPPARSWFSSPWLILLLLGALALVAVPVALYWWLNSAPDETTDAPAPSAMHAMPAAAPSQSAAPPAPAVPAPASPPPVAAEPAAAAAPVAAPVPAVKSVLHLEFGDDAWVEIKDGSGRMVHRQLNRSGSSVDIGGSPPFDLVVGNAAQVRLSYNGRAIDLKPFIDVTVARFTLEE